MLAADTAVDVLPVRSRCTSVSPISCTAAGLAIRPPPGHAAADHPWPAPAAARTATAATPALGTSERPEYDQPSCFRKPDAAHAAGRGPFALPQESKPSILFRPCGRSRKKFFYQQFMHRRVEKPVTSNYQSPFSIWTRVAVRVAAEWIL